MAKKGESKGLPHGFGRCGGEGLAFDYTKYLILYCSAVKALDSCIGTERCQSMGKAVMGLCI